MLLGLAPFIASAQAAAPTITSISPTSIAAESSSTTLMVTGTNFVSGSTVRLNGTALTTTFVSATRLNATIPAANLQTAGSQSITVANPDGTTSNAVTLTVTTLPNTGLGPDENNGFIFDFVSLAGLISLATMALFLAWPKRSYSHLH